MCFNFNCLKFLVMLGIGSPLFAEDLNLKAFFPAGGQRGETVKVQLVGTFPHPVKAWTSSSGIQPAVTAGAKNSLDIVIGEQARPGIHWIRIYDQSTASRLRPFLIETVRELMETDLEQPQLICEIPCIINGRLKEKNEVDEFAIRLEEGESVTFAINANRSLGSPMDCVMQIYDPENEVVLLQNDDAPGRDPMVIFRASRAGDYVVRLFAFPETPNQTIAFAGADDFVYRLTISSCGMLRNTFPLSIGKTLQPLLRGEGPLLQGSDFEQISTDNARDNFVSVFRIGVPGWATAAP